MPRRRWGDGQEVTFEDLNKATPNLEKELYDWILLYMLQNKQNAFFGDSFKVSYVGPTAISLAPGIGIMYDSTQVKPEPLNRLLKLESALPQTLTAADPTLDRIDLVVVKWNRETITQEARKYKDLAGTITTENFDTENDWTYDVQLVLGTPGGVPSPPAVPAGYVKLAELYINAGSGLSGPSDVTDFRELMPIGGDLYIDTTGFKRVTEASLIAIITTLNEMDKLLANANVSVHWGPGQDPAPVKEVEFNQLVWKFSTTDKEVQKLFAYVKVPKGFIPGTQIGLNLGEYCQNASGTQRLIIETSLVRVDTDPINAPVDTYNSNGSILTNTVAYQLRKQALECTDADGKIGAYEVQPDDLLIIELKRWTGDTDANDVRFVPGASSIEFF